MNSLVNKEHTLYESIQNNSHSTNTFLAAFADYFGFLITDGFTLIGHLIPAVIARQEELEALNGKYDEIVAKAATAVQILDVIVEKNDLKSNLILADRIGSLRAFATHNHHGTIDYPLGSNDLELLDAVRELLRLDYKDGALSFLNDTYNPSKDIRSENLIAFENQASYIKQHRAFHDQDTLSVTGALVRLVKLYHQMLVFKDETSISLDDFVDMIQSPIARVTYTNKLKSASLGATNVYPQVGVSQDLSRLHNSITFALSETQQAKLFEIKQDHIYFKNSKLLYKLASDSSDYQYIQLFKNIIRYMPEGVIELHINEFIKLLPDGVESDPEKYRTQLIGNNTSLGQLFKKNKILNSHPNDNQLIFNITRTSIRFNNLYSLE